MSKTDKVVLWLLVVNVIIMWSFFTSSVKERSQEIADHLKRKEAGYYECVKAFKDESQCFKAYFSDFRG